MPSIRVTQAQFERALGGADKLLQLADRNRTGDLSDAGVQAFITEILIDGNAEVNSYIAMAVDINDPAVDTAPILVRYELATDVYLAWLRGTNGIAIPDRVVADKEWAQGELQKIADRKKGLGISPRPVASQQVQQVTKREDEPYFCPFGPRRRYDGWS